MDWQKLPKFISDIESWGTTTQNKREEGVTMVVSFDHKYPERGWTASHKGMSGPMQDVRGSFKSKERAQFAAMKAARCL